MHCDTADSEEIGAPRFELGASRSRTVRATELRYAPNALQFTDVAKMRNVFFAINMFFENLSRKFV